MSPSSRIFPGKITISAFIEIHVSRMGYYSVLKSLATIVAIFLFLPATAQKYDAEMLSQKTDISFSWGKLVIDHSYQIRINNPDGEEYAEVSILYGGMEEVSRIKGRLKYTNGETIRRLKNREINKRSAIPEHSLYKDSYVKEFSLKNATFPYIIEYSYRIKKDEFLFLDRWLPVLDNDIPTYVATLNAKLPKDYPIRIKKNRVEQSSVDTSLMSISYTWQASYRAKVNDETYAPPTDDYLPRVILLPENFEYGVQGSFTSWQSFGHWQHKLMQGLSELPPKEKNTITSLVKNTGSKREKIKTLYHYLQDNTRYINVTIETGGLKPYPAKYVAKNKYGDCKALTNYFRAVLDYVNVPSFYSKVYAGDQINPIDKDFPSQQSNHVILCVPDENDTIWLDCTSNGPFDYLGTFTQNRNALVVDKDTSYFIQTPALSKQEVAECRKAEFIPDNSSKTRARFSNLYRGEKFEVLNQMRNIYNEEDASKIIRNQIVEEGFELRNYEIHTSHRDSSKITLDYTATTNNIYNSYGHEVLIKILPFSIPHLSSPEERTLPVQVAFPEYKTDSLVYTIPDKTRISSTPDSLSIDSEFGHYHIHSKIRGDRVVVYKSYFLKAGTYSLEEYEKFHDFITSVEEAEQDKYIVTTHKKTD